MRHGAAALGAVAVQLAWWADDDVTWTDGDPLASRLDESLTCQHQDELAADVNMGWRGPARGEGDEPHVELGAVDRTLEPVDAEPRAVRRQHGRQLAVLVSTHDLHGR